MKQSLFIRLSCQSLVLLFPLVASAQEPASAAGAVEPVAAPETPPWRVGGHLGVAAPFVTVNADDTTTIADNVTILNPIGIGFKLTPKLVLDFETVVASPIDPVGTTGLVVDPGLIYDFGVLAAGLRIAWQVGATANVGLIPLVNRGIVSFGRATWFIEAAFPTFYASEELTFNAVLHTGIGF